MLSGEEAREVEVALGPQLDDAGFDRLTDRTFANDVGFLERFTSTYHDVAYSRPEKEAMRGEEALSLLEGLFPGSATASLSVPFPLLYELFTRTLSLEAAWRRSNRDRR